MPVPKKRKTRSGRDQRRAHHALKEVNLARCSNCQQPVKPHIVCDNCGHYKGKKVK